MTLREKQRCKIHILNGPNLNLLGIREPQIYGKIGYEELTGRLREYASAREIEVVILQSNHEGALVDAIQNAYREGADGIILNPAAYTHTSIALFDALSAVGLPTVEVHLSDVDHREDFRRINYIRPACFATISGRGIQGYFDALDLLAEKVTKHEDRL